jgi:hypothetical protein
MGKDRGRGGASRPAVSISERALNDSQPWGGKVTAHRALTGVRIMAGLLAQEALVGTVAHSNLSMRLSGTD